MATTPYQILDLAQANVRASEGVGTTTLVVTDNKHQLFNLSAARTVVLPTTGVKAGQKWLIQNSGTFTLTVQSSGLNTLTTVLGTNAILTALQDSPTSAAHWSISNPGETISGTTPAATLTTTSRVNNSTLLLPKGLWLVSGGINGNQAGGGNYIVADLCTSITGANSVLAINSFLAAPGTGGAGNLYGFGFPGVPVLSDGTVTMYLGIQTPTAGTSGGGCIGRIQAVRIN